MTTRSGIFAGLVAGLVFLVVELILVPTVGGGALWGPPRMMGAIVLGPDVLPPPASFDAVVVLTGMLVHFILSAVLGVIFALVVGRMQLSRTMVVLAGIVFGLIVYVVNFYGLTAVFPWFEMARNWITILAHGVFGAVLGLWLTRGRTA